MTWQPIETIPKDRAVLIYCYGDYWVVKWDNWEEYYYAACCDEPFLMEETAQWMDIPPMESEKFADWAKDKLSRRTIHCDLRGCYCLANVSTITVDNVRTLGADYFKNNVRGFGVGCWRELKIALGEIIPDEEEEDELTADDFEGFTETLKEWRQGK